MNRCRFGLALVILVGGAAAAFATDQDSQPPTINWAPLPFSAAVLQDPFSTLDDKSAPDVSAKNEKFRPKHIRDNAFLVEEAFNQEPGIVQHIFNWVQLWDATALGQTRDFQWAYTMELPLGSQKHQFSFTIQALSMFEKPPEGPPGNQGGMGDSFLNYRYQLLADDDFLWCAPRFTVIVPTGDERFGLGTGKLGYQFNLPISRYGEEFDYHFNVGFTCVPQVQPFLADGSRAPGQDIHGFNLGASAFWKPRTNLNLFAEILWLRNEEFDDAGFRQGIHQVFANPGFRYAICQFEEVEWVVGMSIPIGLTRDTPDIGAFVYMSVEHAFRKIGGAD